MKNWTFGLGLIRLTFVFSGAIRNWLVEEHASGGGGSPLQLLHEPRLLASSRPSNMIRKWCISGVSFVVARCTLVFLNMASWGGCSFNVR